MLRLLKREELCAGLFLIAGGRDSLLVSVKIVCQFDCFRIYYISQVDSSSAINKLNFNADEGTATRR